MESMKERGRADLEGVAARALKLAAMGRVANDDAKKIREHIYRAIAVIEVMSEEDKDGEEIINAFERD